MWHLPHHGVASVPHAWHTEWLSCTICVHASPFCEGHTMTKLPNTYQLVINHGITLLWLFLSLLKYLFLFLLLCLCVSAGVHVPCEQVPKDARRKHQISGWELPYVGAEKQTGVLCRSSECPSLSRLSSPTILSLLCSIFPAVYKVHC